MTVVARCPEGKEVNCKSTVKNKCSSLLPLTGRQTQAWARAFTFYVGCVCLSGFSFHNL